MNLSAKYIFLIVIVLLIIILISLAFFQIRNNFPQLSDFNTSISTPLTSSDVCTKAGSERKLHNLYILEGKKTISLYDKLIALEATCKENRLFDAKGKEIYLFERHDCSEVLRSASASINMQEIDNQKIEQLKKSYEVVVVECKQLE